MLLTLPQFLTALLVYAIVYAIAFYRGIEQGKEIMITFFAAGEPKKPTTVKDLYPPREPKP